MISKTIRKASGTVTKAAKPAPRTPAPRKPAPVKPGGGTRGNVETNYRGIPNLVNATAPVPARGKKPTPRMPTPVNPGGVGMTGFKNLVGAGGFGAGFGGGAGMAPAKISPMGSIKNAVGQAVAAKKASDATNRLGKSMLGSMMKKGGKVKAAKASAPKASSASRSGKLVE